MISKIYSSIKEKVPLTIDHSIHDCIEKNLEKKGKTKVFFRADDIAVQSKNFNTMMGLFQYYQVPLCLAVVPSWMTKARWKAMGDYRNQKDLFCWHMHGYQHQNHEKKGKKQEFGPSRFSEDVYLELKKGYSRLKSILGQQVAPFFTPPWNRCSLEAMAALKKLGFKAVSRSIGSEPAPPKGLKDFSIHVDLHTRKEKDADLGWQKLLSELDKGLNASSCGIMLHHMRMNDPAFVFLEFLIKCLKSYDDIQFVSFTDLD